VIVRFSRPAPLSLHVAANRARRGLSLLEVLAALAIFLFSLVALSQLISIGSDRAQEIEWLGRGSLIAQSRMAEVLAGSIALSSQSDATCDEDPDWSWSMDAEPDTPATLYRVKITVSRNRPDGSRFETVLNQMVLDPNSRGATDGSSTSDATATTGGTGTTTGTTTTGGK
jgi:type II secretion system protein I